MAGDHRWTRAAVRLLPRAFRDRFGRDLGETMQALAEDARRQGGRLRQVRYTCRELLTLGRLAFAARRGPDRRDREPARRAWLGGAVVRDLTWAVRYARRRPALALTVVATITVTVAAAVTAFGVASSVLWRPLPFEAAGDLAFAWEEHDRGGEAVAGRVTRARYTAWREAAGAGASLALFGAAGFVLETPGGARAIRGVRVSANYFETLGIRPLLGRTFSPDDEVPGNHQVAVLSHALWQDHFGARADALGETLRLSGSPFTVVGVMPAVTYPAWPVNPAVVTHETGARQFWVPIPRTPQLEQNARAHVFGVLARLHPGTPDADLLDRLNRTADAGAADPHRARLQPFRQQFVADARPALIVLTIAALAVLLIGCTNLAALQAAAFESRRAELATRLAIGASRRQLVRQVALEALLLIAVGTAAGTLAAKGLLAAVPRLLPSSIPVLTVPALDLPALAFAVLLCTLTTAVVAGWPVARLLVASPSPRGVAPAGRARVYRVLVVSQVAMAVVLAFAAGLLGRSLRAVEAQPAGFSIDRVLVADLGLPQSITDPHRAVETERLLLATLEAQPGLASAAVAYDHPLEANWTESPTIEGDAARQTLQRQVDLRIVSPGYFEALGVELLDGRVLSERDTLETPGAVVINEALARELGGAALGRRLHTGTPSAMVAGAPREFQIVGVVANERFRGLEEPAQPAYYLSTRQFPQWSLTLLVRTSDDPLARAAEVRSLVRRVHAAITMDGVTTLETILGEQLATRRVTTEVVGGFAASALALAGLGMYGLLVMLVGTRAREIGIRLAIGASPAAVAGGIVRFGLQNAAIGLLLGAAAALAAGRLMQSLLVGVSGGDPLTLGVVAAALLATAACAALVPARRAARIDPVSALRRE
jgi:predicted permease